MKTPDDVLTYNQAQISELSNDPAGIIVLYRKEHGMRTIGVATLFVFTSCAVFSQTGGKLPEFEVVSIKPAPPPTGPGIRIRMGGDPGRVDYSNVSLKDMIRQAYQVKDYQIMGPDWLESMRYNVVAKVPPDTPKEQIPQMWQSLLADRFKLALHRGRKELPVYLLVVGKNGPKLKESEDNGAPVTPPPGVGPGFPGGRGMVQMGRGRLTARRTTLSGFADILSRQMDRPVVDMTGLKGFYDLTLEWTPDERQSMKFAGAGPGPDGAREERAASPNAPESPSGPTIFAALQEQLGLKMEAKKSAVEVLVIDHAEKAPTEN